MFINKSNVYSKEMTDNRKGDSINWLIGSYKNVFGFWRGKLDDLILYERVLSPSEVEIIYDSY